MNLKTIKLFVITKLNVVDCCWGIGTMVGPAGTGKGEWIGGGGGSGMGTQTRC